MHFVDIATQYQFLFLTAVMIAGFAVLGWMILRTRARMKKILGGLRPSGDAGEDLLRRTMYLEARMEEMAPRLATAEATAVTSIQKVGFVRFNPFQDTGGDNSFSVALLDQKNNGIVLSSLYKRERTNIYAKEVKAGATHIPLSDEEKNVLEIAIHKPSASS